MVQVQGHAACLHAHQHLSERTPVPPVVIQQRPTLLAARCAPLPPLEQLREPRMELPRRNSVEGGVLDPLFPQFGIRAPVQLLWVCCRCLLHDVIQGLLAPCRTHQGLAQYLQLVVTAVGVLKTRHVHGVSCETGHTNALVVEHGVIKGVVVEDLQQMRILQVVPEALKDTCGVALKVHVVHPEPGTGPEVHIIPAVDGEADDSPVAV
mmetsp:Transcript_35403/g.82216  ORF Transcript_35403/g.82216 Transcript_35403/m.82216 type:complete len:208 (+) Transcript_35403:1713-2336(+)